MLEPAAEKVGARSPALGACTTLSRSVMAAAAQKLFRTCYLLSKEMHLTRLEVLLKPTLGYICQTGLAVGLAKVGQLSYHSQIHCIMHILSLYCTRVSSFPGSDSAKVLKEGGASNYAS